MTVRRRTALSLSLVAVLAASGSALAAEAGPEIGAPAPLAAGVVVRPMVLATGSTTPAEDLGARVEAALRTSGATTIAAAVDVDGLGEVYRHEAAHALPPASTQKTFTGLAALLAVPPGTRFTTEVAARTTPTAGRLPGSLWLVAGGDPYLTKTGLRGLAHQVRGTGITYVTGDLLLDDSRYDARRRVPGWKSAYVPDESGPLSALAVDRNGYRDDSGFLSDPALPNTTLFRSYLAAEGVTVHGVVRRYHRPVDARTVAVVTSGPIADVVRRALKRSDNFAAELLLKEVGKAVRNDGSSAGGYAAMSDVLGTRGVPVGTGTDGSGLSSYDRQTPGGQLMLLKAAEQDPAVGTAFRRALPIACQDGTLEKRMCGTAAAGRLSAKTGTLPGARALSGYTTTASGRKVWFSFQLTAFSNGTTARNAIDRAAVVLASAQE
ncbi:MAG: D-alanyl-D-alanine carboxypeptidase/D-alanyl-D-alanine-endopeptidase [Actinobacteria bacterium]|nr:D-alanyl-D-alanine carboxypeptidase/D-alanyl-D-alanine-endopeptidase [Actinomycetota bacterium]MCA1721619.1 D-alanyl-D-alanine carboxypeptidase/D-alanyl-D-alanine-endopeptidase [Actinomycetota bacterium]